ncbi:MAG: hypothetical protein AAGE84_30005 [Cyanobacteria bacterium P01_G01_bin.39]
MSLSVFPLRMQPQLKEAICDRAKIENTTQTELILKAVTAYLLTPCNRKNRN